MKILWIGHFLPWPPHGGAFQRCYYLLKALSEKHDVYVLTFTQKQLCPTEAARYEAEYELSKLCSGLDVYELPTDQSRSAYNHMLLSNLIGDAPYQVARFQNPDFTQRLQELLDQEGLDVVYCDTISTAHHICLNEDVIKILNHHNVESTLLLRRAASERNLFKRWYIRMQGRRLRRWESLTCQLFNENIVVSSEDAINLAGHCENVEAVIIPNGTDTTYFTPGEKPPQKELVFAGSGSWYPNRDAIEWFLRDIWPAVSGAVPEVRLNVVGHNPPPALVEAAQRDERLVAHGFVDDMRPVLARSSVYIVPIRVGGGTRLKILDAFAAGKAVVSTAIGREGITCIDGEHILVADEPNVFAEHVIYLLQHPERCRELGRAARRVVEELYDWRGIGDEFVSLFEQYDPVDEYSVE